MIATTSVLGWTASASAAETVLLRYQSVAARVPLSDIETFAEDGESSSALQAFLEQTSLSPELMASLLDDSIPDTGIPLGRTDIQFLLFQLNKVVGDPLNREDLDPLAQALRSAYLDNNMSVLELVRRYPESEVRLDLRQLENVHRDVELFVQRLTPLLSFFNELLPDMVCECEQETPSIQATVPGTTYSSTPRLPADSSTSDTPVDTVSCEQPPRLATNPDLTLAIAETIGQLKNLYDSGRHNEAVVITQWEPSSSSEVVNVDPTASVPYSPPRLSETVVFVLDPIRLSFSINELTAFAETGDVPSGWRFALGVANVEPEELRTALTSEIELELSDIDQTLNNLIGEYALFQLGQVIQTPSQRANIQALRSSLILSIVDDGTVTLLEFLQNYPASQLIVKATPLIRFTNNLSGRGAVPTVTGNFEDLLVEIQMAIATDICECDATDNEQAES
ncbi:MAG: alpha/beta hydrolase [Cyanobacteria bacterium P01_A01_bin.37]